MTPFAFRCSAVFRGCRLGAARRAYVRALFAAFSLLPSKAHPIPSPLCVFQVRFHLGSHLITTLVMVGHCSALSYDVDDTMATVMKCCGLIMDAVSLLIDRTDTQEKLITVVAVRFDVGSSRCQHSRAGGAGSDDVLEPLSL